MKSIFKLTLGEFKKLFKSYTLYVMTGLLIAAIALMSAVYATQEENVEQLIELFVGGGPEIDSFDIMEGNFSKLEEAGMDVSELEKFSEQLKDKPEIKMLLIGVRPAVLQAMSASDTGNGGGLGIGEGISQFASLDTVQSSLYYDYFRNYYYEALYYNDLLKEQTTLIKESDYTISFSDIIKLSYERLNDAYLDLCAPEGAYYQYKNAVTANESPEAIKNAWDILVTQMNNFYNAWNKFEFYTQVSALGTNYLLMPTKQYLSEEYTALSQAIKAVDSTARKEFSNYIKAVGDYEAVYNFYKDISPNGMAVGGLDKPGYFLPDNDPQITPPNPQTQGVIVDFQKTAHRYAYRMLIGIEQLIHSSENANSLFYSFNPDIQTRVYNHLNNGTQANKEINDFIKKYKVTFEGGAMFIDHTAPVFEIIDKSYTAVITEEIYNREIKPYYDDSEKAKLEQLNGKITENLNKKTDAEIFVTATSPDITEAQKAELMGIYNGLNSAYKEYIARAETIFNLVRNINFAQSIRANNLNDSQTKKISGFLINSRYKLNSSITQAQFLIENGSLSTSYIAPESLTDGYGAVQFIYILTSVIILCYGIVIAAGTIAGEHSDGTMKLLLIRPHTRAQVLTAKFLTVVLALLGFYIINFTVSLAVGAIFWGLSSPYNALAIFNSTTAIVMHPIVVLIWMQLFGFFEAVIFALIALTISTIAKSRSASIAVSMLVYFVAFVLDAILSVYGWYKFVIFNNTNLFMYISSRGPMLADLNLWFSLIVDLVYIVGLVVACFFTFVKRDVS